MVVQLQCELTECRDMVRSSMIPICRLLRDLMVAYQRQRMPALKGAGCIYRRAGKAFCITRLEGG